MLASFPASMVNQNRSDLGILNRFNLTPSRSSSHLLDASRNPTKPGTFSRLKTDRPWRQVAGPAVDMRLATIDNQSDRVKQAH
jgi:hypothetical protein